MPYSRRVADKSKAEETTSQKGGIQGRRNRYKSKRRGPITATNNKDPRRD